MACGGIGENGWIESRRWCVSLFFESMMGSLRWCWCQLRGDRPKNAFTLLKVLADSFGKAYLETALDTYVSLFSPSLLLSLFLSALCSHVRFLQRYSSIITLRPSPRTLSLNPLSPQTSRHDYATLATLHLYCSRPTRRNLGDSSKRNGNLL